MAQRLIFPEPGKVAYEDFDPGAPGPGQVRVRAILSGISHGTEMVGFTGRSPFRDRKIMPDRIFLDREAGDAPFYPFRYAGYDMVGEITAAAAGVQDVRVGDRVFVTVPHQTEFVTAEAACMKLRAETRPEDGIMISLATVALVAVHDAEVKLGDNVVVFGAGVVGQLVTQEALLDGARRVYLVDPDAARRQFFRDPRIVPVDPGAGPAALTIKRLNGGEWPDVVLECSGTVKGLAAAIQAAGLAGTVIAVGFLAGPATDLCLGEEFMHNRVTVKASMGVWGCPSRCPERWGRTRELRTVLDLIEERWLKLDGFVTLVPFQQAQRAYARIRDQKGVMRIALSYPREKE